MKLQLMLVLGLSTLACATGYHPTFYFNQIQVVNLAVAKIANVRIGFVGSTKNLNCEEVARHAMCADRFGKRLYPQKGIELSWTHTDGSRRSDLFSPAIPATYNPVFPLRIVMEINADGSVKPFYEQDEPDRDGILIFSG